MTLLGHESKEALEDIDLIIKKECLPKRVQESCIFIMFIITF